MRDDIIQKELVIAIIIIFIGTSILPSAISAETQKITINTMIIKECIVDDEGDGNYTKIQDAIDSCECDIIRVYSGNYTEDILVYKDNIEIIGIDEEYLNGNDTGDPQIEGKITINGSKVTIRNLSVMRGIDLFNNCEVNLFDLIASWITDIGISLENSNNNIVERCFAYTMGLDHSNNNLIKDCEITTCFTNIALVLGDSNNNSLIGNNISANSINPNIGLLLGNSHNNKINFNTCWTDGYKPNRDIAIKLESSDNNYINNSNIWQSGTGISLIGSDKNTIFYNIISNNVKYAISFKDESAKNEVLNNTIIDNHDGISLVNSLGNRIINNNIEDSENRSIYMSRSNGDKIHKNNIESPETFMLYAELSMSNAMLNYWGSFLGPTFRTFRLFFGFVLVRPCIHKRISHDCP